MQHLENVLNNNIDQSTSIALKESLIQANHFLPREREKYLQMIYFTKY